MKTRESNFELLRIISMLMIVMLHYLSKGGALWKTQPFEANYLITHLLESFSIVAVNCYIMISGYFLISSTFKWKKVITLWAQVLFYSIGIYIIALMLHLEHFTLKSFALVSFPVFFKQYWFISGYLVLLFLSPLLNIAIKAFTRRQLELLLLIGCALILWSNLVPTLFLTITSGYSCTHFIFLYVLAAYIRLYWDFKIHKYIFLFGYILCASTIGLMYVPLKMIGKIQWWPILLDYAFIGVVLGAFCLFMFIRDIKITSPLINRIAALALSVYLIHEHPSVRSILYFQLLHTDDFYHSSFLILHALASVFTVFVIAICIDVPRKLVFDAVILRFGNRHQTIKEPLEKVLS